MININVWSKEYAEIESQKFILTDRSELIKFIENV